VHVVQPSHRRQTAAGQRPYEVAAAHLVASTGNR
jgi:hypothetical protein